LEEAFPFISSLYNKRPVLFVKEERQDAARVVAEQYQGHIRLDGREPR
jgi:hypothetical protein